MGCPKQIDRAEGCHVWSPQAAPSNAERHVRHNIAAALSIGDIVKATTSPVERRPIVSRRRLITPLGNSLSKHFPRPRACERFARGTGLKNLMADVV